jgi:glycosyltransferase involved in cell wall biosynthesis
LLDGGGIFVDPDDQDALAQALRVMAADTVARDRMARTAALKADELSWEASARSLKACFDQMMESRR